MGGSVVDSFELCSMYFLILFHMGGGQILPALKFSSL